MVPCIDVLVKLPLGQGIIRPAVTDEGVGFPKPSAASQLAETEPPTQAYGDTVKGWTFLKVCLKKKNWNWVWRNFGPSF